jgi:hypothetical protein
MNDVGRFKGHCVYFTSICIILWPFGIFCSNFGVFFRFGKLYQEKSGNPGTSTTYLCPSSMDLVLSSMSG